MPPSHRTTMLARFHPSRRPTAAITLVWIVLAALPLPGGQPLWAAEGSVQPVPKVPAGVVISPPDATQWNRVIYLAVSRITQGDAASVPETVRSRVARFTLALMATVTNTNSSEESPSYELTEVGVGYAVPLGGQLTIVSTQNPPSQAGIDYLGRQVLAANGKNLSEVRCLGASSTAQVIDVDALYHLRGRNTPLVVRHFIWVEPRSGRCTCCVWLLAKKARGAFALAGFPPRWLQEGTRDNRSIHVDDDAFVLGIPTREAFALTSLPPGLELAWTADLQRLAVLPTYGENDLQQTLVAIDQALQPFRKPAN